MIFISPDDIKIPEGRFRESFNPRKMQELEDSIKRVGLINPITVETDGDTWLLRAGARRLRALKKLISENVPIRCGTESETGGLVPAVEWDKLSSLERLEIEISENIDRDDFTFQERSRAVARLHEFRKQQNPEQTVQDTATEVAGKAADEKVEGRPVTDVSEALIIAKHLHDPDVARAKDKKEALKIIKRKADAQHRVKLAQIFDLSKTQHKLIKGKAGEILPQLQQNSFDVILTDPPYGVGANSFGDQSSTGHDYEDSPKYLEEILSYFCDESFRVAKAKAHCYVFCDVRKFERIGTLMVLAGWKVFPTPLIWYKWNGMVPLPKLGPKRTYECILYAYKGDRETIVLKNDVIIKIPSVRNLKHGAQKPVALYCDLLSRSANPGDSILDCYGGTGPIIVAANRLKLVATYIEQADDPFNIALSRVHTVEIDDGAIENDGISINFE